MVSRVRAQVRNNDEAFDGISGEDWVKSRTLEQLQEQFGVGIGQMLHDGKITLADAVKSGGLKPMTLKELQDNLGIPETVRAIERRKWTKAFKTQSTALYNRFKQAGFELDIHGVSRLGRLHKKGYVEVDAEQVLEFLQNNRANFYQEGDGRVIFFSKQLQTAVIQAPNDGKIITVVRMKKAKTTWKILDGS